MAGGAQSSDDRARTDPDADVQTRKLPNAAPAPITESISIHSVDDEAPSSVRPSSPTLPTARTESTPARPVVVRTTPPPSPVPAGLPLSPATTTPTGRDPNDPRAPPSPEPRTSPTPSPAPTGERTSTSLPPISPARTSQRGLIGAILGRYEILEEVGHGGMATVYRARDPRLERNVALKVIHPHLRDNPEIAQRFRHEARAVAKLKHPAIVEIYDVPDEEGDERFLVAEYVDGPSLRKWLQQTQKELAQEFPEISAGRAPLMPPEIAGALVLQILGALGRAHQEGIVHRDVKPENILLAGLGVPSSNRPSDPNRPQPTAKLTDFGIAKILDAQSMTSTGQILGSPAHMAPEQIEGGDVSPRVDVFATGVLFYELLTGALPFDGKNPAQVIRRVLEGQFTAADRVAPTVGGRWAAIVASMLARDPEKRPADVDEVCGSIRRELEAMGVSDPDRALIEYLRDPIGVMRGWGERVKPKLLERAVKAREQGDSIGAANDLNRALAYDPGDPRLMRVVTSLRSRERRMAAIRRAAPIVVLGALVVGGTFLGVRRLQEQPIQRDPNTPTSSIATPSIPTGVTSATGTAPTTTTSGTTSPSTLTSATTHPTISPTHDAAVAVQAKRMVRFNIFPAGTFSIDGGPALDPLTAGAQELTIGEHTITAIGAQQCCQPYSQKWKIVEGDGEQPLLIKLAFNPAHVFVQTEAGAVSIRVLDGSGNVLGSGVGEANVTLSATEVPVTIVMESNGIPTKQVGRTIHPGEPIYVDFP